MGNERIHDGLVRRLEGELEDAGYYDELITFYEYCRNGCVGELDLVGVIDGLWDYYEVKCNDHRKARQKARYQYHKFQRAFPNIARNGYMYSRGGLITLR